MRLTPRYEGPPALVLDPVGDPSAPLVRQRRRLAATVAAFDAEQWAAPSRCAGWTNRDVICHLITTNSFWAASITAGRAGEPTRFLPGFDPVVTPAQLVEATPFIGTTELLAKFVATNDAIEQALDGVDAAGWEVMAEAPAGHLALAAVASHALWDAWVHERDICVPLGVAVPEVPDEVMSSLRFVAGLGPAFLAISGSTRIGAFAVRAIDLDRTVVVDVGPTVVVRDDLVALGLPTVAGDAVALTEAFSLRSAPPVLPEADRWMVDALGVMFDQGA